MLLQQYSDDLNNWRKAVARMEEESAVPWLLMYFAFDAVYQYLGSDQDKLFWKQKLFESFFHHQLNKFSDRDWYNMKDPEMARLANHMQLPAKLSEMKKSKCELLKKMVKNEVIKNYHVAADTVAWLQMVAFREQMGKDIFDYVLEDLKEEVSSFSIMQLRYQHRENSN
jgi:hypothetical protein